MGGVRVRREGVGRAVTAAFPAARARACRGARRAQRGRLGQPCPRARARPPPTRQQLVGAGEALRPELPRAGAPPPARARARRGSLGAQRVLRRRQLSAAVHLLLPPKHARQRGGARGRAGGGRSGGAAAAAAAAAVERRCRIVPLVLRRRRRRRGDGRAGALPRVAALRRVSVTRMRRFWIGSCVT